MSDDKNNIQKSLIKALKAGQVIPFVGAGVSMAVKKKNDDGSQSNESLFPSWKGFVEILANALKNEDKPNEADYILTCINIGKPKYLEAIQHAKDQLGEALWYQIFNENFDKLKAEAHEDSFKLPKLIWQLSNNLIITTNVDCVFQWTCPKSSEFKSLDVQNVEFAQLQKEQTPKCPTVWYLHGNVLHKEEAIFTHDQYKAFYEEKNKEAKLQTLLNFLTQRTLLFIGFSLEDAYIREQLEYIHKLYKGGANSFYILLHEREIEKIKLLEYVKPISFSDFGEPLLEKIRKLVNSAKVNDNRQEEIFQIENQDSQTQEENSKKLFFNVPYKSKGKEFVGRKDKMKEIWNLFNEEGYASIGQAVSIKGFGGLGKTQLVVEYAHEYKEKYKNGIFWLVADENIDNQLLQIAYKQGWINQFDKSLNQLDLSKARFLELSRCLIIFDNVESYDDIKDYLPKTDLQTHILITTREKQLAFRRIDLELLERNESRELLLKVSDRNPQNEAEKEHLENILKILGDIPLAIELVGGYLAEHKNVTFAKYNQFLNDIPLDKLEKEFPEGSFTNHDRSIIRTLRISEKLINDKPLMVEILNVLAWSGNSSMGTSLLQALVTKDEFEFATALGDAINLRVLKKDEDAERYAIHRLLAKVIRRENPLEKNKEWHEKIMHKLEVWFDERKNQFEKLTEFETEIEHLQEWQKETLNTYPSQAILLTSLSGNPFWLRGNYKKALIYQFEALDLYNKEKVKNKRLLAILHNTIGFLYWELDNFNDARKHCEEALNFYYQAKATDKKLLANILNDIGLSYDGLDKKEQALQYHQQALEIRLKEFREKHSDTAISLNNVGSINSDLGNHEEALKYQLQALEIRRELFGEKHPDTAASLNNVGFAYSDLGNYEEALKYQLQALEIHQELLERQHPVSVIIATNLINNYCKSEKIGEAAKLADEFLSYIPENHPRRHFFEQLAAGYRQTQQEKKKSRKR
jgi:tetratricopeptide (TPR) repeat protein